MKRLAVASVELRSHPEVTELGKGRRPRVTFVIGAGGCRIAARGGPP